MSINASLEDMSMHQTLVFMIQKKKLKNVREMMVGM